MAPITPQLLRDSHQIKVTVDEKDRLIFTVKAHTLRGVKTLEIFCPVVQGRIQFKSAKISPFGTDPNPPENWTIETLEETLSNILDVERRDLEVHHDMPLEAVEVDYSETAQHLRSAVEAYVRVLGIETDEQRLAAAPLFARFCMEIFVEKKQ